MLRRPSIALLSTPLLLWAALASADITGSPAPNQLYGHITSNRALTFASPGPNYEIIGDLTIDAGVTLTIERGVTLTASSNSDYLATGLYRGLVEVIVSGTLTVPAGPGLTLITSNGGTASWGGLRVLPGGQALLSDFRIQSPLVGVRVSGLGSCHLVRSVVEAVMDGVHFENSSAGSVVECLISGTSNGTGIRTPFSLSASDSLTPNPTVIRSFTTGLDVADIGTSSSIDHFLIRNCGTGVNIPALGVRLSYITVIESGTGVRAHVPGAQVYNSVIVASPAFNANAQQYLYCNYVDVWGGSYVDPFWPASTGAAVSSFNPYFDYSDFSLDPASFFTNFSVSGGEIGAFGPGPVGPTPILAAIVVYAVGKGGFAKIRWFSESRGSSKAGIFRRTEDGDWQPLTVLYPDGQGYVTLEDRDVSPGTRYGYGVGVQRDSRVGIEGEVWVTVEAQVSGLSLASIEPNPASTNWSVAFMSPEAADSHVDVVDLSGRVVRSVGLGRMGVGRQAVSVNAQGLSPGVYWIRLRQGDRSVLAKAVKTN